MKLSKKTLMYIIIAVSSVLLITLGTVFTLNLINNKKEAAVPTQESADSTKTQAIEALKNNDDEKAKTLFEEAKAEYEELGDTNNIVDTEAQLYLLNHKN